MAENEKNDRPQRLILIGLIAFALILIAATIFSTLTEWDMREDQPAETAEPPPVPEQ